jgi:hypothetical protein
MQKNPGYRAPAQFVRYKHSFYEYLYHLCAKRNKLPGEGVKKGKEGDLPFLELLYKKSVPAMGGW